MDVDKAAPKYDKHTMRDENGHYPVWMRKSRDIKKMKGKQVHKVKSGGGKGSGGGGKKGRARKKGIAW